MQKMKMKIHLLNLMEASLDSDDDEEESLPSLESLVSLSLSLLLFVVLFGE